MVLVVEGCSKLIGEAGKLAVCDGSGKARSEKHPTMISAPRSAEDENVCENGARMRQRGKKYPYLLELLDGTLVDTTALVDQVCIFVRTLLLDREGKNELTASGGGLAGIDVADDDHVDVHLFFTVPVSDITHEMTCARGKDVAMMRR